jgi:hypothetical protein
VTVGAKKVIAWLVVACAVFFLIKSPEGSADLVRSAGTTLGSAASSLADFVATLV